MLQGCLNPTKYEEKYDSRGWKSRTQTYFGESIGDRREVAMLFEEIVHTKEDAP